jgi:hypothetical protein
VGSTSLFQLIPSSNQLQVPSIRQLMSTFHL